jgi:hypothetical protein
VSLASFSSQPERWLGFEQAPFFGFFGTNFTTRANARLCLVVHYMHAPFQCPNLRLAFRAVLGTTSTAALVRLLLMICFSVFFLVSLGDVESAAIRDTHVLLKFAFNDQDGGGDCAVLAQPLGAVSLMRM